VYITAKDNKSIGIIEKAIEKVLNLCDSDMTNARLASERQYTAAQKALLALQDANIAVQSGITLDAVGVCIDDALAALYSLTGESASEDIINEVFSKFCVGK
ncbi:MAG: tRNA uridine-5-carboxymethylaminomethyl(34) synthesis GTPase MnmE, partial [Oscillospiraceae bacterium]